MLLISFLYLVDGAREDSETSVVSVSITLVANRNSSYDIELWLENKAA